MFVRVLACCAAVVLFPLASLSPAVAQSCGGSECADGAQAKPTKPLDILKFMREQAASTRAANPRAKPARTQTQTVARAPHRAHHILTARRQLPASPTPAVPDEASSSFAAQDNPTVQVVAGDEFNAIDAAGNPAPAAATPASAQTVGSAATAEPAVPLVVADEFNDIDAKAAESAARVEEQAHAEQASVSWLHRIWSALGHTFTALAMAVHNLIG